MGNLLDEARKDWLEITSAGGFEVDITLESPALFSADVKGLAMQHSMSFDFESGANVRAPQIHATISEAALVAVNYPVRINGNVNMLNHKLSFKDSTDTLRAYAITENFPDETVGIITFNLVEYGTN